MPGIVFVMAMDGRRRDSPPTLNIDLTGGKLVLLAERFEPPNSLEKRFEAAARAFVVSAGN
jgi:hypothetical protein